jgi:hypothetical protein
MDGQVYSLSVEMSVTKQLDQFLAQQERGKRSQSAAFLFTAGALCIVCAVATFLPGFTENGGIDVRQVVAGLGCALELWAAGAATL